METKKTICRAEFEFAGAHEVEYLSILCSDFRFFQGTLELYDSLGICSPDEIKIPGGIMSVVRRDAEVLRWIKTLHELHSFKKVVFVAHSGCGAYRACGISFRDDAREQTFHGNELKKARDILREEIPSIEKLVLVYARLTADNKLIEYESIG